MKLIEKFAKILCKEYKDDPKLWENHVQLVRKYALRLAKVEKADKEVVEIAALLHDIGKSKGRKGHAERSYELSKCLDLPEKKKELILKCIKKHGCKRSDKKDELEVKIIQAADALGTLFDEKWQEYSRKTMSKKELSKVYDKTMKKIRLKSGLKIAEPQIKKLRKKLK